MRKNGERDFIVGLDIGTSKVVAIVGEVYENNEIEVIGIGSHPSRGLSRGVVVNIESTVHSIQKAVEEAELMAGCDINSVYAGIAGNHIRSLNSHGIVAIQDNEVRIRITLLPPNTVVTCFAFDSAPSHSPGRPASHPS